jgi:hypothetical protein
MTFREVTAAVAAQGGVAIAPTRPIPALGRPESGGRRGLGSYDEATVDRWRYAGLTLDILLSYGDSPAEILLGIVRHRGGARAVRRRPAVAGWWPSEPDAHQNIRVLGRQLDRYPLAFRLVTTYLFAEDHTKTRSSTPCAGEDVFRLRCVDAGGDVRFPDR